jgi:phosphoribosylanthranilate isomerase
VAEVKFCGLTRAEDAARAATLGARYVGVIFAGGPRVLTAERAAEVLAAVPAGTARRVGVLGAQDADTALRLAGIAALDVLQMTYGAERERRIGLRERFAGELWAVSHVDSVKGIAVDEVLRWYDDGVDAVVLDAAVPGQLGGTGVRLDWAAIAPAVNALRARGRVVLAGGLRPENVADALRVLDVDVVDVSSGVESAPGIKDPERMRAFAAAARTHEV